MFRYIIPGTPEYPRYVYSVVSSYECLSFPVFGSHDIFVSCLYDCEFVPHCYGQACGDRSYPVLPLSYYQVHLVPYLLPGTTYHWYLVRVPTSKYVFFMSRNFILVMLHQVPSICHVVYASRINFPCTNFNQQASWWWSWWSWWVGGSGINSSGVSIASYISPSLSPAVQVLHADLVHM